MCLSVPTKQMGWQNWLKTSTSSSWLHAQKASRHPHYSVSKREPGRFNREAMLTSSKRLWLQYCPAYTEPGCRSIEGSAVLFLLLWQEFMPPEPFHLPLRGLTGGSVYWQAQVTPSVAFDVKVFFLTGQGPENWSLSACVLRRIFAETTHPRQICFDTVHSPTASNQNKHDERVTCSPLVPLTPEQKGGGGVYKRKICVCLDTKLHCKTIRIPKAGHYALPFRGFTDTRNPGRKSERLGKKCTCKISKWTYMENILSGTALRGLSNDHRRGKPLWYQHQADSL